MSAITSFYKNPKKLLLLDGMGAILSAFLLGFVLAKLEYLFGIPISALYILASIPIIFAIFDFYNYQRKDGNLNKALKTIAFMNLFYCILSVAIAFFHYETITIWGWGYIIVEIIIVATLAGIEWNVSEKPTIN